MRPEVAEQVQMPAPEKAEAPVVAQGALTSRQVLVTLVDSIRPKETQAATILRGKAVAAVALELLATEKPAVLALPARLRAPTPTTPVVALDGSARLRGRAY